MPFKNFKILQDQHNEFVAAALCIIDFAAMDIDASYCDLTTGENGGMKDKLETIRLEASIGRLKK